MLRSSRWYSSSSALGGIVTIGLCIGPGASPLVAGPPDREALARALALMTRPRQVSGFEATSERGRRGLRHVLQGRALPFVVPVWAHELVAPPADPVDRWLQEGLLPSPFQDHDAFLVGLGETVLEDDTGLRLLGRGCLTCHAGPLEGKVVAGLPNAHLDLVPVTESAEQLVALDLIAVLEEARLADRVGDVFGDYVPGRLRDSYRYVRDYEDYARETLLPSYRHARVRGDNTGAFGAWFMTAKISDPEASGIVQRAPGDSRTAADERLVDAAVLPPVDSMPWWNVRFKDRAYRFRDAPGHTPLAFNFNFYVPQKHVDSGATLDAHRAKVGARAELVGEVLQWVREVPVPPLPPRAQAELRSRWPAVERGEALFHGGPNSLGRPMPCASCHGTYRTEGVALVVDYPNRDLLEVGTDPAYSQVLRRFAPLTEKLARTRGFYGPASAPRSEPVTRPGYAAPVLVGAWASAPYLHNGSVPTLADMLAPAAERPEIWGRRPELPGVVDFERGGLPVERIPRRALRELAARAEGAAARDAVAVELRRFYDTTEYGRSNQGHHFGTRLNAREKRDLQAFLTSLAPLDWRPMVVAKEGAEGR